MGRRNAMGKYDHIRVDETPLTEQEIFVLDLVGKGHLADLKKQFGDEEENRHLRASFLEELLTNNINNFIPHRRGIRIINAIITEPIDLENSKINFDTVLLDCHFNASLNFRDTTFRKNLTLNHSNFLKNVIFHRIKIKGGLLLRDSIFLMGLDASYANIEGNFEIDRAEFKNVKEVINLNSLKVGQTAIFREAIFQGPVSLISSNIGGQFIAEGAKFNSKEKADFDGMKVDNLFVIRKALFQGHVNFRTLKVGVQLLANEAHFINEDKGTNFNAIHVGQNAHFINAVFNGHVDFTGMSVGGQFNASGARFNNKNGYANFNSIRVNFDASFEKTVFEGPVNFVAANIGRQLILDEAQFNNSKDLIKLNGLIVADITSLLGAVFKRGASISDSYFHDLLIGLRNIDELELERVNIERELIVIETKVNKFKSKNMHVKGLATYQNVVVHHSADLRDSIYQSLELIEVTWPKEKDAVWIDGLAYKAISAKKTVEAPEDWKEILNWIEMSRFNTQNYRHLEAYFSRCGHRDRADEVFISGKREAANLLPWGKKWLTRIFWGGLAGYGRKPWQVLYVIFPLVALGTFLFAPEFTAKSLESYGWLNQMKQNHPWVIQFLVSLDRFLPGVDLGLAKEWSPACVGLFTFAYWYFLKLAGWITIPISLAAIYTRIK
jgi:hypothetical protein